MAGGLNEVATEWHNAPGTKDYVDLESAEGTRRTRPAFFFVASWERMAKIRITPRYHELQAMDVAAVEEDEDIPMEVEQPSSPKPSSHGHPSGCERATSAEPEDHHMGDCDEADEGEDDEYPVRKNYERAASVEPEELDARANHKRVMSVETEENEARLAYKRATCLEPDMLSDATMDDGFDVPKASRPAPPPPKHRVEDYINVQSRRKIPPSIYKEVMKARCRPSQENTSPSVWVQQFQRMTSNTATLPTLRQGLVRRGIKVVGRPRGFQGEGYTQTVRIRLTDPPKDLDQRDYAATMLDPSVLYKMIKDDVAVEQLKLTMEFVLSEK